MGEFINSWTFRNNFSLVFLPFIVSLINCFSSGKEAFWFWNLNKSWFWILNISLWLRALSYAIWMIYHIVDNIMAKLNFFNIILNWLPCLLFHSLRSCHLLSKSWFSVCYRFHNFVILSIWTIINIISQCNFLMINWFLLNCFNLYSLDLNWFYLCSYAKRNLFLVSVFAWHLYWVSNGWFWSIDKRCSFCFGSSWLSLSSFGISWFSLGWFNFNWFRLNLSLRFLWFVFFFSRSGCLFIFLWLVFLLWLFSMFVMMMFFFSVWVTRWSGITWWIRIRSMMMMLLMMVPSLLVMFMFLFSSLWKVLFFCRCRFISWFRLFLFCCFCFFGFNWWSGLF